MCKAVFFVLFFFSCHTCISQARLFQPGLAPKNQAFGLTLSPAGDELFFVNSFGGRDSLQIYQSKKVAGTWQAAKLAPFSDMGLKQIDPFYSPDGKMLLYNSLTSQETNFDVYAVHKKDTGWGIPVRLPNTINTNASEFYATISNKRNIYFTRRTQSNDIYVSYFVNNEYQPSVRLDSLINTDGNESNPYISPEEDYLIFFSDRKGSYGENDLYISFQKSNKWSRPINLGKKVNTSISEFCPGVDAKNQIFFFSRTEVVDGRRKENIYQISLKKLKLKSLRKAAVYN